MMFVLFFLFDLFICHKFTQSCFSAVATTAVGTSVPALRLSLIGWKSRGAFVFTEKHVLTHYVGYSWLCYAYYHIQLPMSLLSPWPKVE